MTPLRIASELHTAPGWIALVPDDGRSGFYRDDVVLWIAPHKDSLDIAKQIIEAVHASQSIG